MKAPAAVTFDDVSFSYRDRPVLDGASFSLDPASFCLLEGDNGAGKSTVMKLILGEEKPQAGCVRVLGRDPASGGFSGRVGYIAQRPEGDVRVFPATVLELVQAGTYPLARRVLPYGRKLRVKAREAIAQVGLEGFEKSLLGELSGGQFQRAQLAHALVSSPELLLLDEPTSNLDAQGASELCRLVEESVRATGAAALMVTHDLARLPDVFDRAFRLEAGRIVSL